MTARNILREPTRARPPISSVSRRATGSAFGSAKESDDPISVWSGIFSLKRTSQAMVLLVKKSEAPPLGKSRWRNYIREATGGEKVCATPTTTRLIVLADLAAI